MKPMTIGQTITDRSDSSILLYLKDVSKIKLLTQEEEIELSKRIQEGDKQALDKLITSNLRFAFSIAKQYQHQGLSLVDLVQEANIGLYKAASTFDGTKGYKFISYAVWWIRQSILKALSDQCRTVRVPMSQLVYINKINKLSEQFEQKFGRRPTLEELDLGDDVDYEKISSALSSITKSISLDTPFKEEENSSLLDILPNNNANSTDSGIIEDTFTTELNSILNRLSFRNRDIIKMAFGIGMSPMQNEEIANRFGIGSERVRQLKEATLEYLKNHYGEELKSLM